MKKHIILDTNFLLAVSQFKIDIFSELDRICDFPYTINVVDKTLDEINKIIQTQGKDRAAAKLALDLVKEKKIHVLKSKGDFVDDILVNLSSKDNIIATQDKELKRRINNEIIIIKQKKYLTFRGS